ncbi:MAG: hypothetical protein U5K43_07575 [Halofilum sp. (in: g-proteobacteria)]|nr:hypothetical protein [Halofilum sp. (in: g-proteobacteria)]
MDKRPDDVAGFEALRAESREQGEDWDIVLAAALSGRGDAAPGDDDIEQAFSSIIKNIHAGGDLSGLLAFDRDGDPLRFVSAS